MRTSNMNLLGLAETSLMLFFMNFSWLIIIRIFVEISTEKNSCLLQSKLRGRDHFWPDSGQGVLWRRALRLRSRFQPTLWIVQMIFWFYNQFNKLIYIAWQFDC